MFEGPVHDIDRCRDRVFFRADRRFFNLRFWVAGPQGAIMSIGQRQREAERRVKERARRAR
ncbi:MAG: hypothetical protein DI540_23900 [Sphingobium sp.]|nr:MAG: hypothetical protein DI540_23900 [Sphingobium sp.]